MRTSNIPNSAEAIQKENERRAIRNLQIAMVVFVIFLVGLVWAISSYGNEMVQVMVDMTLSSSAVDHSNTSEFDKNLDAVSRIIQKGRPGTQFKICGITNDSFGKPCILLEGRIGTRTGYFGQFTKRDIDFLLEKWRKVSEPLSPFAKETDIIGSFFLAESFFSSSKSDSKILIYLSDMRHSVRVNLEKQELVDIKMVDAVTRTFGVPSLGNMKTFVLGAHANGKSTAYWVSLRAFWTQFIKNSGGELKVFSAEREVNYHE